MSGRGNPSSGRQVSDLTPPSMSTPRPSEADVEALAEEVERAIHRADDRLERSKALHLILGETDASVERVARFMRWADAYAEESREVVVNAVLASDWLAARDAKHEREVAEAEVRGQMRHITAEVARGDQSLGEKEDLIADLRARLSRVGAERDSWRARAATNRDGWRQMLTRAEETERALADLRGEIKALADEWEVIGLGGVAVDLRALLPRDDAAGAGGAE